MTESNRMTAWRTNQTESGKKRLDVFIGSEQHDHLSIIKEETRESYGDIVTRIIGQDASLSTSDNPKRQRIYIDIPKAHLARLEQEHGDMKGYLESLAIEEARELFASDELDDDDF